MSKEFDPYHRWLGIPPKHQPADYYRLLGLELFESDPEVIRDAAERQIAHVRGYALGKHSELSQRILNELGKAKACLLNAAEKADYDRELRQSIKAQQTDAPPVPLEASSPSPSDPERPSSPVVGAPQSIPLNVSVPGSGRTAVRKRTKRRRRETRWKAVGSLVSIVLGGVGGICVAIVLLWVAWKKDPLGIFESGKVAQQSGEVDSTGNKMNTPLPGKSTGPTLNSRPNSHERRSASSPSTKESPSKRQPPPTKPEGKRAPPPAKETRSEPPLAIAPFDAEAAKRHQQAWAGYLGVPAEMTNSIGMRFVLIPPGEFDMGSTEKEVAKLLVEAEAGKLFSWYVERLPFEAPKHRVRITKPFWLSRHEVTRGEFRRFVDDRGYQTEAERDGKGGFRWLNGKLVQDPRFVWDAEAGFPQTEDHPVVEVSWHDAVAFCEWLSEKENAKCHLATEAQWEYACRAGSTTSWHCGDNNTALQEYGWLKANSGGTTHPVGQLRPNVWGLCDMHGNVLEWCHDRWASDYYGMSPFEDPSGPAAGSYRVIRGGGRGDDAPYCRASARNWFNPALCHLTLSFRVAIESANPLIPKGHSTKKSETPDGADLANDLDGRAKVTQPEGKPDPPPAKDTPSEPPLAIAPFDAEQARPSPGKAAKRPQRVPVDLLKLFDVRKHSLHGQWMKKGQPPESASVIQMQRYRRAERRAREGSLYSPAVVQQHAKPDYVIQIPVDLPTEYVLKVTAERLNGTGSLLIGHVAPNLRFVLSIDCGRDGDCTGLGCVDGESPATNETTRRGKRLKNNVASQVLFTVREDRIVARIDGTEALHWTGDRKRLSLAGDSLANFLRPGEGILLGCSGQSAFRFDTVELLTANGDN